MKKSGEGKKYEKKKKKKLVGCLLKQCLKPTLV